MITHSNTIFEKQFVLDFLKVDTSVPVGNVTLNPEIFQDLAKGDVKRRNEGLFIL